MHRAHQSTLSKAPVGRSNLGGRPRGPTRIDNPVRNGPKSSQTTGVPQRICQPVVTAA